MTYIDGPGVLADLAGFLAIYYNESYVFTKYTEDELFYYYEIKNKLKNELPIILHPFIYVSDKTNSFVKNIVIELPFEEQTFIGLINYISSDKFISDFF